MSTLRGSEPARHDRSLAEKSTPARTVDIDEVGAVLPTVGVPVSDEPHVWRVPVGRSASKQCCVMAGPFHDDLEEGRGLVSLDLRAIAEGVDAFRDRPIAKRLIRPHANEAVERPGQVPVPPTGRGQVPVDEHPPGRTGDEVPWSEVVVGEHFSRSRRIATFVSPRGVLARNKSFLCPVVVGDQAADATKASAVRDQVQSVWMHTAARYVRQHFAIAIVETQRSRRRVRTLSEVLEQVMDRRCPWAGSPANGVADADDVRVGVPIVQALFGVCHHPIVAGRRSRRADLGVAAV